MDMVEMCKNKLEQFRIKELKDILSRVGISKQGRKQDLMDRVLAVLYDEGSSTVYKYIKGKEDLVAIIDDAYRKMQEEGANDSNTKKQSSAINNRKKQEEGEPVMVRCICDHSGDVGLPIKCADPKCNVWQHTGCTVSSEKDIKKHPFETQFFCQTCRIERADPFCETIDHLLYPVKLLVSDIPVDGTKPYQHIEKFFELSKENKDFLAKVDYDAQAWCILLSDSVPFRAQWPQYAELLVNGVPFKTYSRPGSQSLGANGRDDGVKISLYLVDGVNKISLSGCDDRDFCLGVRLVKKQTLQQVLKMIPSESAGESFDDALTRVKRCTGGGVVAENEDSDSDLEVVTDSITVSLRCPMSGCRMKTAGRFKPCVHMGCFDLETFVQMNERSRKWQCPVCLKNYSLENMTIDPYFNRILNMMRNCKEEISDIELKPDGSWRVKNEVVTTDLSLWHYPDGSLSVISGPSDPIKTDDNSTPGKQEYAVARHVGQVEDMSQFNLLGTQVTNFDVEVITMSSSSSEDHKDDAILSFQKDGGGDQLGDSGYNEVDSHPPKYGLLQGKGDLNSGTQVMNADVIILSDSEDDDVSLLQPDSSIATVGHDRSLILPTIMSSHRTIDDVGSFQRLFTSISENCSGFHSIIAAEGNLDAVTGFDQPRHNISGLVNGNKMVIVDNGHTGNGVVGSSVLANDVIASSSSAQDCVTSVDNSLHGQNCSALPPVSRIMTPIQNSVPSGKDSFNAVAHKQTTRCDPRESLFYVRSKRRLPPPPNTNGESCLDLDASERRSGDPFSFPRRLRSARRNVN